MSASKTVLSFRREGGQTITLGNGEHDKTFHLLEGSLGLGVAPASFASTAVPGGHGSHLRGKRLDERDVFVPVLVESDSAGGVVAEKDRLEKLLSPVDPRPLWLRVEVPGREGYRELPVHYAGGLQGDYGSEAGFDFLRLGLQFRSFSAFWYGDTKTISRSVNPGTKPFLSATEPFFPVVLSDSVVDAQLTLNVAGDAPTFPVWTVVPPGEDLNIVHTTSGRKFFVDGVLTETITIDMEAESIRSATIPEATWWDRVSADSHPFPLLPGENVLEFSLVGADSSSLVHVTYRPRFLAGH